MNKYKDLGTINFMIGASLVIISVIFLTLVLPKLSGVYSEFGLGAVSILSSLPVFFVAGLGLANILIGSFLLKKRQINDALLKKGQILALLSCIIAVIVIIVSVSSSMAPLYTLTK